MVPPSAGDPSRGVSHRLVRWAFGVGGVLVSVLALVAVALSVDVPAAIDLLGKADGVWVLVGFGVVVIQTCVLAVRWRWLLPLTADGRLVALGTSWRVLIIGTLVNIGVPARVGDAARAVLVGRMAGVSSAAGLGSVVVERGLDVAALGLAGFAAGTIVGAPALVVEISGAVALVAILGLVLLWSGLLGWMAGRLVPRLRGRRLSPVIGPLERLSVGVEVARARGHLVSSATATVVSVLLDGVLVWLAAHALGVALSPAEALVVGAAAVLITGVPSAPANVGTFELAAVFVLVDLGVPAELSLAIAVLLHAMIVVPVAAAGVVLLLGGIGRSGAARDGLARSRAGSRPGSRDAGWGTRPTADPRDPL